MNNCYGLRRSKPAHRARVARSHRRHINAARRHTPILRRNLRAHSRLVAAVRTVRSVRPRDPQLVTPWYNEQAGAGGHILQVDEDNHVLFHAINSCQRILSESDSMAQPRFEEASLTPAWQRQSLLTS